MIGVVRKPSEASNVGITKPVASEGWAGKSNGCNLERGPSGKQAHKLIRDVDLWGLAKQSDVNLFYYVLGSEMLLIFFLSS